ncbi:MAG: 50S ribosomal protein L15 [Lentisphaeria bacterium]|jgi:large subunit ribosomal protein L15
MKLHDLHNTVKRPARKRIGRGDGSGTGRTAGHGEKGAGARKGVSWRPHFEGGQMPLFRRLPKRGFNNPNHLTFTVVNVSDLDRYFAAGEEVSAETLWGKGLIGGLENGGLKILGDGEIGKAVTVKARKFSAAARQKIEAAGGTCEVVA